MTIAELNRLTVTLLIDSKDEILAGNARRLSAYHRGEIPCPECEAIGPHEDNGLYGEECELLCADCGYTFPQPPFEAIVSM